MGTRVLLAVKFKMAAVLGLVKLFSRKRKAEEQFLSRHYKINEKMAMFSVIFPFKFFGGHAFLDGLLSILEDRFVFSLLQRKRVQFVTKLVFLVCRDERKVLELCFCRCPISLFCTFFSLAFAMLLSLACNR